ncbi:hypothetical protein V3C99_008656 [Haemonchus contortus]|nr:Metridin ShK toxin domain containing protein [Haemonchus contortus]
MLLCFVSVLFLVNVFTAEVKPCEDTLDSKFCQLMKKRGECQMGDYLNLAKGACAKTCERCTPEEPKKPKGDECENELDGKTCYEMYERGNCEIDEIKNKLCRQMCHTCW